VCTVKIHWVDLYVYIQIYTVSCCPYRVEASCCLLVSIALKEPDFLAVKPVSVLMYWTVLPTNRSTLLLIVMTWSAVVLQCKRRWIPRLNVLTTGDFDIIAGEYS
jgi:hypothetical protein